MIFNNLKTYKPLQKDGTDKPNKGWDAVKPNN